MITMTVTGRLISDATYREKEDKKFITFTLITNTFKEDSVLINCIRSVSKEPTNIASYAKGSVLSVSGEPSINLFTKEGETAPNANYQLTVNSLMIISTDKSKNEESN